MIDKKLLRYLTVKKDFDLNITILLKRTRIKLKIKKIRKLDMPKRQAGNKKINRVTS